MPNRLSHSAVTKFQHCGKAYDFHYNKKIRTNVSKAALCFGTALDRSTGELLKGESLKKAKDNFDYNWRFQDVNGTRVYLPTHDKLVYAKSDFDKDLLSEDDCIKIERTKEVILSLVSKREEKGFESLSNEEKIITNQAFWFCLQKKGHYMLEAFKKKVMPRLTNVLSTQESISIKNDDGDEVIGYIDLVSEVKGYDSPVILDIKTSAMKYDEDDAVIFSPQLSLYMHAVGEKYNTRLAGFIVLNKQLIKNKVKTCKVCKYVAESGSRHKTCNKEVEKNWCAPNPPINPAAVSFIRCNGEWDEVIDPEVYVQFLVEEIPFATEELVLNNISDINTAISTGNYTANLSSCLNSFGSKCEFLELCYYGRMNGLVDTSKEKK